MINLEQSIIYINGILNIAVIGFIIRFSLMMKSAFKEKEDILQKRLDSFKEELTRTEKWADRNKAKLEKDRDELKKRLDDILIEAKVDMKSYNLVNAVQKINTQLKDSLREVSTKIVNLESPPEDENIEINISLAKAFASNNEWLKAANQYDLATRSIRGNWELYFYKGIAYANSRKGVETDLQALQAYADAIVYIPKSIDENLKARLFIYKGAMFRRLNRLDEAENYIKLGLNYAYRAYEVNDGLYNLACVYAMNGDYKRYSNIAEKLRNQDIENYNCLLSRVKDYAPKFLDNYL